MLNRLNKTQDAAKVISEYLQKSEISNLGRGNLLRLFALLCIHSDSEISVIHALQCLEEAVLCFYNINSQEGILLCKKVMLKIYKTKKDAILAFLPGHESKIQQFLDSQAEEEKKQEGNLNKEIPKNKQHITKILDKVGTDVISREWVLETCGVDVNEDLDKASGSNKNDRKFSLPVKRDTIILNIKTT